MVHYKLTYFDVRGLGEVSRQLFHLANVEFDDVRVPRNGKEWDGMKDGTPFGQLPVLEVDGVEIPQSMAIGRYLARKFGYAGRTAEEEAWCDAIVDLFKVFILSLKKFTLARRRGDSAEQLKHIRETIVNPARDVYFKNLNKLLEKSKSGYLVGDGLTWADLVVADNLTTLANLKFYDREVEKKLGEYQERINSTDGLKQWLEKRPVTVQ